MLATDIDKALSTPSLDGVMADEAEGRSRFEAIMDSPNELSTALSIARDDVRYVGEGIDSGTSREVYIVDGLIVKLPMQTWDSNNSLLANCYSNLAEVVAYETGQYVGPIVPCRIVWHVSGIPLVVMEKVNTMAPEGDKPDWAYRVDMYQVAWSELLNEWACYDAGDCVYSELPSYLQNAYDADRLRGWIELARERAEEQQAQAA